LSRSVYLHSFCPKNMKRLLLLDIIIYGILFNNTWAWHVDMPHSVYGIEKSCLVIPCKFSYSSYPPKNSYRIVWYLYDTWRYPVVFDEWYPSSVIERYRGKTRLNNKSYRDCSLLIKDLSLSQNGDRIYTWVDPENIGKFTKRFFDVTTLIHVRPKSYAVAPKPEVTIFGGYKIGQSITLQCKTNYPCPDDPPSLRLSGIRKTNDNLERSSTGVGTWTITLSHYGVLESENIEVICSVTHSNGLSASTTKTHNAACTYDKVTIEPEVADVVEGVANNFTCTVFHSCKSQPPTFTWNYKDIPETVGTKKGPSLTWATYSNILFIASMKDDGKKLTCTSKRPSGETFQTSVVLQVQRYVPKVVDPFENDTIHILEANVVPKISALTKSCVVIPCTFQSGDMPIMRLRVLWYTSTGQYVFHTGQSNVIDNFKGRTRLLGNPDEQNCTLEIDKVQVHDNGPFCFHAEKGNDKYRFNHSCVFILMKASPDKPVISAIPKEMEPGKRLTINCSVTHTCSSHPPVITWNVPAAREVVSHVEQSAGKWETTSTITFIPTGYEEEENLICRASFWRGKNQESSVLLNVKRIGGLGMDTIWFGIILPLFLILLLFIAAGIVIFRRRVKKTTTDALPPERRRSIWSQISRRFDTTASWLNSPMETSLPVRPPKPDKRRSIWGRFSRRGPVQTSTDLTVQYKVNNVSATTTSAGYSKSRFPSPK
ncbi:hypothetical protein DAT39_004024, partial [Clarias magur]